MKYWKAVCTACKKGRVFVMRKAGADCPLLQCEECKAVWTTPEESSDPAKALKDQPALAEFARTIDIEKAGWAPAAFFKITDNRTIC